MDKSFRIPNCAPAKCWGLSLAKFFQTYFLQLCLSSCGSWGEKGLFCKIDWTASLKASCCSNWDALAAGPSCLGRVASTSCLKAWGFSEVFKALWSSRIALLGQEDPKTRWVLAHPAPLPGRSCYSCWTLQRSYEQPWTRGQHAKERQCTSSSLPKRSQSIHPHMWSSCKHIFCYPRSPTVCRKDLNMCNSPNLRLQFSTPNLANIYWKMLSKTFWR